MNIQNTVVFTDSENPQDYLSIANNGPDIIETNFCRSAYGRRGLLFMSVNAGTFRLLVPPQLQSCIPDMRRGAKHVVLSLGERWGRQMIEWLVEDNSNTPFAIHFETLVCDRVFGPEDVGKEWRASVWDFQNGKPHKCIERPAFCQIVPTLPWLQRIDR